MIGISDDRQKHCIGVARLMYEMSLQKGWGLEKSKEMFTLGFLHDIGYEFSEKQEEHPQIGGTLLKEQGYKYWKEVYYHGTVTDEYQSEELMLLDVADMLIDSCGVRVEAAERLEDILRRYGVESKQYKEAKLLANKLGLLR